MGRLQLQGELQAKKDAPKQYRGVLHAVKVILQNEGPRGLFRGIGSAVCVSALRKLTFVLTFRGV
jgi:solute carrier family 25 protein 34/35